MSIILPYNRYSKQFHARYTMVKLTQEHIVKTPFNVPSFEVFSYVLLNFALCYKPEGRGFESR
jgi:hypothetical protein